MSDGPINGLMDQLKTDVDRPSESDVRWYLEMSAVTFQVATQSEDKFKKMKDVYGKLREEHIQLLRSDSEKKKQISSINEKLEQVRCMVCFTAIHYFLHNLHCPFPVFVDFLEACLNLAVSIVIQWSTVIKVCPPIN